MKKSTRPALMLSEIRPQHINLREGERPSVRCPDCMTWHPLHRRMIKTHRLDSTLRGGATPPCPGSGLRIDYDISVEEWGQRLMEGNTEASACRSARQHYKPLPGPAPAVAQMAARPAYLATVATRAHRAVRVHYIGCTSCVPDAWCAVGEDLAQQLFRAEDARDQAAKRTTSARRSAQWRRIDAKGKVQAADAARLQHLAAALGLNSRTA